MPLDWNPVMLQTDLWEAASELGVYRHSGRVYIEGVIEALTAGFEGGAPLDAFGRVPIGTFDASLAPAGEVRLTAYTWRISDGPAAHSYDLYVTAAGEVFVQEWIRPESLIFGLIIHASWDDGGVDDPPAQTVGGMSCAPHGTRMHLFETTAFDDGAGIVIGSGIPEDYRPSTGGPILFAGNAELLVGGTPLRVQTRTPYAHSTEHLTIDAADVGKTADWGSWIAPEFNVSEDEIVVATFAGSDVSDIAGLRINHTMQITPAYPLIAASEDIHGSGLPATIVCYHDDNTFECSFYKLVLWRGPAGWFKVLFRHNDRAAPTDPDGWVTIGDVSVPAPTFVEPFEPFDLSVGVFLLPEYAQTVDGIATDDYPDSTHLLVFRIFDTPSSYNVMVDPTPLESTVSLWPGDSAISPSENGGDGWAGQGEFVVLAIAPAATLNEVDAGVPIDPAPYEAGWHMTSVLQTGDILSGVVRAPAIVRGALPLRG